MIDPTPAAAPNSSGPAIEGIDLVKAFGGVVALGGASFSAYPGEVHALVGENGAGKSTLIKLLGGRLRPDSGVVKYYGQPVQLHSPQDARRLGAATVFQELTQFPGMTIAENLLIGREPRGALGLIDRRRMTAEAAAILAGMGLHDIDPGELVEDVSLAQRQIVEIVRAVLTEPKILFLDEPTSSLVEREVEWLFGMVRKLRAEGTSVIFTSGGAGIRSRSSSSACASRTVLNEFHSSSYPGALCGVLSSTESWSTTWRCSAWATAINLLAVPNAG